jgi:hypothetical protein
MKSSSWMFYFFIPVLVMLAAGCSNPDKQQNIAAIDSTQWNINTSLLTSDSLVNGIFENTYNTVDIDSSDYVIFPLAAALFDRNGEEEGVFFSKSSYKDGGNGYWNFVFYNTANREAHLLDTSKILIRNFYVNDSEKMGAFAARYIFYEVAVKDFNGNGILDYRDPVYLYCSDLEGKNFRRVSPENCHLVNWTVPKKSSIVLAQIVADGNRDRKFDNKDLDSWIRIDFDPVIQSTPVFNSAIEEKIKTLFKKHYSKKPDGAE